MIKNLSCPTAPVTVALPTYKGYSLYATGTTVKSLPVAPGSIGDLTSILEVGTGEVYFTLDGTAPTAAPGPNKGRVSGAVAVSVQDVDLSLVRLAGTSPASAYTVTYHVRL